MFDLFDQLETIISEASLHTRMAIMFVSIVAGIALSQLGFALLRKAAARMTDRSYPLVRRALRGMPTLWGVLLGGYIAVQILTVPPRALLFLERIFNIIGIVSLTIMVVLTIGQVMPVVVAQQVQQGKAVVRDDIVHRLRGLASVCLI